MTEYKVKSVGVWSMVKLFALGGVIVGVIMAFFMMVMAALMAAGMTLAPQGSEVSQLLPAAGLSVGVQILNTQAMIFFYPLIMGMAGAIYGVVYNLLAMAGGALVIRLEKVE